LWAALRILSEQRASKGGNEAEKPHLLLIDEPELCLHPDAIREACRVLYDLPSAGNWQVMVTTHSPVFIDLARKNTSIVRVERRDDGGVQGTTIFRPTRAKLDDDDRTRLKLLNICDPFVAEFFFGGRTVVVEGDTEYAAFGYLIAADPKRYKNIHIVRARGKYPIVSLCKILNQFGSSYSVLHDSDEPTYWNQKTRKHENNTAWPANEAILEAVKLAPQHTKIRLVAALTNFEQAFLGGASKDREKPYFAVQRLMKEESARAAVCALLDALVDHSKPLPAGAMDWAALGDLQTEVNKRSKQQLSLFT
jgi:putative ATP-dependent endonuclease of OLD family